MAVLGLVPVPREGLAGKSGVADFGHGRVGLQELVHARDHGQQRVRDGLVLCVTLPVMYRVAYQRRQQDRWRREGLLVVSQILDSRVTSLRLPFVMRFLSLNQSRNPEPSVTSYSFVFLLQMKWLPL